MVSFRFQRSTSAPANGLKRTVGANPKNATSARAVARSVIWYAQMISANWDMADPINEKICPAQMMEKVFMPEELEGSGGIAGDILSRKIKAD